MSHGLEIYSASGQLQMGGDSFLWRVIGYETVSFLAGEYTTKTFTFAGLLNTDRVMFGDVGSSALIRCIVSRSGEVVSVNRTAAQGGVASSHVVYALRGG